MVPYHKIFWKHYWWTVEKCGHPGSSYLTCIVWISQKRRWIGCLLPVIRPWKFSFNPIRLCLATTACPSPSFLAPFLCLKIKKYILHIWYLLLVFCHFCHECMALPTCLWLLFWSFFLQNLKIMMIVQTIWLTKQWSPRSGFDMD